MGLVEGVVPAASALTDIGAAIAGDRHIQDGERANGLGVRRCDGIGRRAAPVVPDQMERIDAQLVVHQPPNIVANCLLVVALRWAGGITQAAQIRCDDPIPLREFRHDMPPLVPGLRPTMQQYDGESRPSGDVVQADVAQIGVVVDHRYPQGRGGDHGLTHDFSSTAQTLHDSQAGR